MSNLRLALVSAVVLAACTSVRAIAAEDARLAVPGAANGMVSLAARGNTVAAVWAATAAGITNIYCAVSNDGGRSFSSPQRVNDRDGDAHLSSEQPPRVVVNDTIDVIWTARDDGAGALRLARSTDRCGTFMPAVTWPAPGLRGARGWESLAGAPDGSLHTVWLDGRDAARIDAAEGERRHHEGMHHAGASASRNAAATRPAPRQDVFHAVKTADGGVKETRLATDVCFCCKTALALGQNGVINAAWRHVYPGSLRDIAFTRSRDGGRTFAAPIRVSHDDWQLDGCPDDGPSMAVDAEGTVHLVWPTLVETSGPHIALMYASTRDGRRFTPRQAVKTLGSLKPSHPNLSFDGRGLVLMWDESIEGARRIGISRAELGVGKAARFGSPTALSEEDAGVYPAVVATPDGLLVAWTSGKGDASFVRVRRIDAERRAGRTSVEEGSTRPLPRR